MSSDRLLGIDKRFVDFRRKPKELLTEDDKNEGVRSYPSLLRSFPPPPSLLFVASRYLRAQVIPYMPELLFRASDILNQNNTVRVPSSFPRAGVSGTMRLNATHTPHAKRHADLWAARNPDGADLPGVDLPRVRVGRRLVLHACDTVGRLRHVERGIASVLVLFLLCHFIADGGRIVQDFEYYPLLATVIAVVVLTVVTSFLVASKKLREAWQ